MKKILGSQIASAPKRLIGFAAASTLALGVAFCGGLNVGAAHAQGQGSGNVGAGGSGTSTGPGARARTGEGNQNRNRGPAAISAESVLFSSSIEDLAGTARSSTGQDDCSDVAEWGTMGERFTARNMGRLVRVHDALVGEQEPKLAYQTIFLLASFQAELLESAPDTGKAGNLIAMAVGGEVDTEQVQSASAALCASIDSGMAEKISKSSKLAEN